MTSVVELWFQGGRIIWTLHYCEESIVSSASLGLPSWVSKG